MERQRDLPSAPRNRYGEIFSAQGPEEVLEEIRRARQALREFVEGAAAGDASRILSSFDHLDYGDIHGAGWVSAMRAIARLGSVPARTQEVFLRAYVRSGDHIRQETANDLVLIKGLRILLLPYVGPSVSLYRAQNAPKPRARLYGLSWSTSREVAESYIEWRWRRATGGSILLHTFAPPEAIICRVEGDEDVYRQEEYLVDRRRLHRVKRLAKYPPRQTHSS
jgi:hypothetical protein